MNIAVGAHHARHRAILIARNHVAAVFDPQVASIFFSATILGLVVGRAAVDVVVEYLHHLGVFIRVDHALPGEHAVLQCMAMIAEHFVPAWVAVDEPGIGVPIPDPVADQLQDGVQHVGVEVREILL